VYAPAQASGRAAPAASDEPARVSPAKTSAAAAAAGRAAAGRAAAAPAAAGPASEYRPAREYRYFVCVEVDYFNQTSTLTKSV
jgi:hypothetical protein